MSNSPTFLALGHVTRDIQLDGSFTLGGTVAFAALTASRLGLEAGIVTCADAELTTQLPSLLPGIQLTVQPSIQSTTFANRYQEGFRTQYLYSRADSLELSSVPPAWLEAEIVLLGPLAQELDVDFVKHIPRRPGQLLAATPQGWLRRWESDGRVWPTPWQDAEQILPLLDVLILSHDDLLPFADGDRTEADALLARWSQFIPLLVATDGRYGATLYQAGQPQKFAAYPVQEIDPTGAGDVFAAAFLTHLFWHQDPAQAVNFANCAAACSIEQPGMLGIPTLAQVLARMQS
ncbi:PfkB family carbohydrate kinase [Tengunoibacter tsumagoiensis]|uniref:Ribokinase n=1 Tax=Tengunoibacter tsumagoiensis TaxID=2014871 RepID=A0A401ZVU1_9CHLR|nr:PfkB family carbohydrate kinase [Tengunoibacter tsumagoiensis]GCE11028.1 ribokinase [Tengunoibacter tsumagoiensis]